MKFLLRLNFFALGLPFALVIIGFLSPDFFMLALLSTMITGGVQVIIALLLLLINHRNIHLYIYLTLTTLFFAFWLVFNIEYWLFVFPPALAIYLTYIVGTEYKKSTL